MSKFPKTNLKLSNVLKLIVRDNNRGVALAKLPVIAKNKSPKLTDDQQSTPGRPIKACVWMLKSQEMFLMSYRGLLLCKSGIPAKNHPF